MGDPRIEYRPTDERGYKWQCTIHSGPGHHGLGLTKSHALCNAAAAWDAWGNAVKLKIESEEAD